MAFPLTRQFLRVFPFFVVLSTLAGCKSEKQMRLDRWGATLLDSVDVEFQRERNDCGVACAIMLLQAHGIPADRARIRSSLQLQPTGVNMLSLINVLEVEHLSARGIKCASEYLRQVSLPAIVLIDDQHYMVLDSIRNEKEYFLRDPAVGRITVDKESFAKIWSGIVLVVELSKRMR